jgi:putative Holliday junction resolvase
MRVLAIDVGQRRVGLAVSDPSGTLARPLTTLTVDADSVVDQVAHKIAQLAAEDDGVGEIVVGMPLHLDGSPSDQTARVTAFVAALQARTAVAVRVIDERLTSHEAESRLAVTERDWRKRKEMLDAAAAAVFLQDYLDHGRHR